MRKIDLSDYSAHVRDEKGEWTDLPYEVKDSMVEILMARELQLSGRELLSRDDLARKIRNCANSNVLLEEEEWNKIVTAVETVKGLGRTDVEFVRRVLEAEKIEVEAKK